MNKEFKIPASSPKELTQLEVLKERLKPLIGTEFILTGKSRTDGSNTRKLIASQLEKFPVPAVASED
jgi:recombinational DNA repair protein RecR